MVMFLAAFCGLAIFAFPLAIIFLVLFFVFNIVFSVPFLLFIIIMVLISTPLRSLLRGCHGRCDTWDFHGWRCAGKTVIENAVLNGPLNLFGKIRIVETICNQDVSILGSVKAINSTFIKTLTVYGKLKLIHSTAQDIVITNNFFEPHMHVKDTSTVYGTITFKQRPGVVYISADSVFEGTIINGRLVSK
jgi:hypothetical protein